MLCLIVSSNGSHRSLGFHVLLRNDSPTYEKSKYGWIGGVGGCIVELEHEAITFTK